jgi:hypothetical protein
VRRHVGDRWQQAGGGHAEGVRPAERLVPWGRGDDQVAVACRGGELDIERAPRERVRHRRGVGGDDLRVAGEVDAVARAQAREVHALDEQREGRAAVGGEGRRRALT